MNYSVTCIDLFDTHNIKNTKFSKALLGTLTGSLIIQDFEMNRTIVEKNLSKSRIEIVASSTVKFYDSYLSRIAICCRGDPTVYTFTYNHSFAVVNQEFTINLNKNNCLPGEYPLDIIPAEVKFSNDTYFMYIIDYSGGIRIYKFFDIPKPPSVGEGGNRSSSPIGSGQMNEKVDAKVPTSKGSKQNIVEEKKDIKKDVKNEKKTDDYILIYQGKYSKIENFVPFNIKKPEESKDPKDKKSDKKKEPEKPVLKKGEKPVVVDKPPSEDNYNIKTVIDETSNCDLSNLSKYSSNKPFIQFIKKKMIFEEKVGGGFASTLMTVGAYISFANTTSLKFISFYNYLTENMKNTFKVIKTRGIASMSNDEAMLLNSQMPKSEREFLSFLKSKIEQTLPGLNSSSSNSNLNPIIDKEVNFSLLYQVSVMALQQKFNDKINYLGIGMNEGSILVWDVELHTEKFFFQDNNSAIITLSINSCFLTSGSLDGKFNIYNLTTGENTFTCYHNGYKNLPITNVII